MGGTLIEFENVPWDDLYPASVQSVHEWLSKRGKRLPSYEAFLERFHTILDRRRKRSREEMREYHITPLIRELITGFKITLPPGHLSEAVDVYYGPIRKHLTVFPEANRTLATLRENGYTIGLLSNTPFRAQDHRHDLAHFGLWDHFDATVFSSTMKYRKPHPEPFKVICKRLGVSPTRSLYIGDRQLEDVQGPQAVGMTACLIRRDGKKYQEGLSKSVEIRTLDELVYLLS
jgi:putative hydrolase of the HAD superfamily